MSLIEVGDIEDYLGRTLSAAESTAASPLIGRIVAETESILGRTIEVAEFTETALILYVGSDWIPLAHTPVRAVASLVVDGATWAASAYDVERSGIRLVPAPAISIASDWAVNSLVDVRYTAGLGEPAATALKTPLLSRLARIVNKVRDDAIGTDSISVEGYNAAYMSEGFTDDEMKAMSRHRRRVIAV